MHKKGILRVITEDELILIVKQMLKGTRITKQKYHIFARTRNASMCIFSYYLGLRPKECRCIKLSDFRGKRLYIPAENNKQRNNDVIPIPDFLFTKLLNYIDYLKTTFPNSIYLFPKRDLKPLDRGSHIRFFRYASRRVGIYNVSLYSLRHSFGTNCYLKLRDIQKTAILLRHYDCSCRTTMRYIHTASPVMREELFQELYNFN